MFTTGVILARAGSKGLPDKCVKLLLGRPMIEYTFEHARQSRLLNQIVLTTDSAAATELAAKRDIRVVSRPPELANDTATVDAAARHALATLEADGVPKSDAVVFLYGNIPVRAPGIIDRVIRHLADTGADSVRTVAPVGKQHPDWLHRLDDDRMIQFRENSIHRRQDLSPLYYHDGAVVAVTRNALDAGGAEEADAHAFFGTDRRAVVQEPEDAVDVDTIMDLYVAEAVMKAQRQNMRMWTPP